jgi:AAA domain
MAAALRRGAAAHSERLPVVGARSQSHLPRKTTRRFVRPSDAAARTRWETPAGGSSRARTPPAIARAVHGNTRLPHGRPACPSPPSADLRCVQPLRKAAADTALSGAGEPSVPQQMWNWFRRAVLFRTSVYVVGAGLAVYGYYTQTEGYLLRRVVGAFERGVANTPVGDVPAHFVERPTLQRALAAEMHPSSDRLTYTFVVGPRGVGKTTALLSTLRELEGEPKGVVYFDCRTPGGTRHVARELADVLGWHKPFVPQERLRLWLNGETRKDRLPELNEEPWASWHPLSKVLFDAGNDFAKQHQRPMVLVLDAVDAIAKENEKFLLELQGFAKVCADKRILKVIFVASEGRALELMERQSAWSRASRPLEVGDLLDDEAIAFLVEKKGIDKARAEEAVAKLCGGRFADLLKYADDVSKEQSNEQIRFHKDNDMEDKLLRTGLSPTHPFFRALLDTEDHSMPGRKAAGLLGGVDKVQELLQHNILTVNSDHFISFHDRHSLDYFVRTFR